jgi:hypothetical protein|tara:strand:+ start:10014 stop:10406 length:393 start_codon:yes stop_codon:yes gene_type:complete
VSDYGLTKYLTAINWSKEKLLDTDDKDWEKKYPPYIINKGLSYFPDTVMYANEMNRLHHATKHMQFSFLLNTIRPKKRFSKWLKASKLSNLDVVKQYYGYSNEKAKQALELLTKKQIEYIKETLYRGGKK